ncbi:MAG: TIGR03084 family metal-binding protein [Actinomycetota bacterium]|nr:TIGR03084 family metal-binding protein [Actinomycetota bacterium]
MADLAPVLADLIVEADNLDAIVGGLSEAAWATPTPAPGWTIAHQIAHLAWTDDIARLAATDPASFRARLDDMPVHQDGYVDRVARERAQQPAERVLSGWREGRAALADALRAIPERTRLPWFGPPMSATSMATARLMETWAHGQDVADTLGVLRVPTERLRQVAHIGVRTRDFAYLVHGSAPPAEPFRIELMAPSGQTWTWGPHDAVQRVTGPALDFCLLVTQRRNRRDLALTATGAEADGWLDIAQAFAGPPGGGRAPGQSA